MSEIGVGKVKFDFGSQIGLVRHEKGLMESKEKFSFKIYFVNSKI